VSDYLATEAYYVAGVEGYRGDVVTLDGLDDGRARAAGLIPIDAETAKELRIEANRAYVNLTPRAAWSALVREGATTRRALLEPLP
jgi:hypothetical protein